MRCIKNTLKLSSLPFRHGVCMRNTDRTDLVQTYVDLYSSLKNQPITEYPCVCILLLSLWGENSSSHDKAAVFGDHLAVHSKDTRGQSRLSFEGTILTLPFHTRNCALNIYVKWNICRATVFNSNKVVILKHLSSE